MRSLAVILLSLALQAQAATYIFTTNDAGVSAFPKISGANSSLFGLNGSGQLAMVANSSFAAASHTQAWSTITSTPTTLSGYSITGTTAQFNAALTDGDFATVTDRATMKPMESDFMHVSADLGGLANTVVGSGLAVTAAATSSSHIGVSGLQDSATATAACSYGTNVAAILLAGGEKGEFVFYCDSAAATVISRLGFQDSPSQTAPTDGVWINLAGDGTGVTASGKTANNTSTSTTGTTTTLTVATWYRGVVELNSNATTATFTIYAENGTQVWTNTLSTNIPTGSGRQTGFILMTSESTVDAGATRLSLDYFKLSCSRTLTR